MLSTAWGLVQNLVACGVAWAVFTFATSRFETVVLALLVLIYAAVLTIQITTSASLSERHLAANKQFVNVLRALNDPLGNDPDIQDLLDEEIAAHKKSIIPMVTNLIFVTILYLIGVWKLLSAFF